MHPLEITILDDGATLLIEWADGSHSRIGGRLLRSACGCNRCSSERRGASPVHIPITSVNPDAVRILSVDLPSSSRLSVHWGDRHDVSFFRFSDLIDLVPRELPDSKEET